MIVTIAGFFPGGTMTSQQYEGIPLLAIGTRVEKLLDGGARTVVVNMGA